MLLVRLSCRSMDENEAIIGLKGWAPARDSLAIGMTTENSSDVWRDDEHGHRLQVYPYPHQIVIQQMCSRHSVQQCSASLPSQHRLQCLKGETRYIRTAE